MKLEDQNILIVSNEAWGPVWYSKHNYAWQLSQKNKVYFLNPAVRFSPLNVFKKNLVSEKINDNLITLSYKNILPVKLNFFRLINEWYVFKILHRYFDNNKVKNIVFWTFDPIRLSTPEKLNPKIIILHAVDHYLFTYPSEILLSKKADYVFCVSDVIARSYQKYTTKTYVIPHAVPDDEFLPIKTERSKKITGIYVGTIDIRLDFNFINHITNVFPDITFRFIGVIRPSIETMFNKDKNNIIFEGALPFTELKHQIREADFCFLFKDIYHLGNSISSHKMLQYFAQGKPIFATIMEQYKSINTLLYMENDLEKMEKMMRHFVEHCENQELIQKRIDYAKEHSFSNTLLKIEKIVS